MANFMILLPKDEVDFSEINDYKNIKLIDAEKTVEEAHNAIKDGADGIIARGSEANELKAKTDYTVVEIFVTFQELGLLMNKAKKILGKQKPRVSIVGIRNMFSDTDKFNELFDVDLKTYFVEQKSDFQKAVKQAVDEGTEIIIGGKSANYYAKYYKRPGMIVDFLSKESIENAISRAEAFVSANNYTKKNSLQLQILLDNTFNGIFKINKNGNIENLNAKAGEILGISAGNNISDYNPEIMNEISEKDFFVSEINKKPYVFWVKKEKGGGAFVSVFEEEILSGIASETRKSSFSVSNDFTFDLLEKKSPGLSGVIKSAKLYSQNKLPILISGQIGSEREFISQAIHNENFNTGSYIEFNCAAFPEKAQFKYLFKNEDNESLLELARNGTLVLQNFEYLSKACQQFLIQILNKSCDFKAIFITESNIVKLVKENIIYKELYYLINTFSIQIPSFADRENDIANWAEFYLKEYCEKYSKTLAFTIDSKNIISKYNWDGGLLQLQNFIERAVVISTGKTLKEKFIKEELLKTYPILENTDKNIEFEDLEAIEIKMLLDENNGNRTKVAEKLGISTTTLWRRLKKFNIKNKFE